MDRQSAQPANGPRPTGSYESASLGIVAPGESKIDGLVDWFQLEKEPTARLLKVGRFRKTWFVQTDQGGFVAKVFDRPCGIIPSLRSVFGLADPARREFRVLRRALNRGVRVCRPVKFSSDPRQARSLLVVEAVPDALTLTDAWTQATRDARRRLTATVARTLAEAHEQGFLHPDLHPGNLLIHGELDRPQATMVDVLGAKLTARAVRFEHAVTSLAQLDQSFHRIARRAERLRFLRGYMRFRSLGDENWKAWVRGTLSTRILRAERLARQRDRRLGGGNKYFDRHKLGGGWSATVVLQLERRHLFPEPDVADRTSDEWSVGLARLSTSFNATRSGLIVEHARPAGFAEALRWTLCGSQPKRRFIEAHTKRHRDVQAELVLGFAEHRTALGVVDEAVVLLPARNTGSIPPCEKG